MMTLLSLKISYIVIVCKNIEQIFFMTETTVKIEIFPFTTISSNLDIQFSFAIFYLFLLLS